MTNANVDILVKKNGYCLNLVIKNVMSSKIREESSNFLGQI